VLSPLFHSRNPKPLGIAGSGQGGFEVKADAVIFQRQVNPAILPFQAEVHQLRFAVAGNVVESLLEDSEDDNLQRLRDVVLVQVDLLFNGDAGVGLLKFTAKPADGGNDAEIVKDRWSKSGVDPACFLDGILDYRDDLCQGPDPSPGMFPGQRVQHTLNIELDRSQRLADAVMEFPCDPFPLLLLGGQQLRGQEA